MEKTKPLREKGKLKLSKYFQKLNDGDKVSIVKEVSIPSDFPERLQGRTGTVTGMRGKSAVIKIKDQAKEKIFLIAPIHLKKIKQ